MTRKILTEKDATQLANEFENAVDELAQIPTGNMLVVIKPPYKCADCKTKFKLRSGIKALNEKLCPNCFTARLHRGYAKMKQAEALTGRKLVDADLNNAIKEIEEITGTEPPPPTNTN
jgi:DNA-directed RNA polymerase subunit RPC12/RpoP